jgi:hypothetical protein
MSVKEKPPEYFKSVKTSLKSILKHPELNLPIINNVVIKCHKIVIHTLQFIKLYLLHFYENNNNTLPIIDKKLIMYVMKILCIKKANGGAKLNEDTKELKEHLTNFYNNHYKSLIQEDVLDYENLSNVLAYLTEDILTMYENNIVLHYIEYVERFVNVIWKKKPSIESIKNSDKTKEEKVEEIRKICNELRKVKKDLLNIEKKYKSDSKYHSWIVEQQKHVLPNKNKYEKDNLMYDLKANSLTYFTCMIYMMKQVQHDNENNTIYNVFPMRSEITPKYIRLDTTTLVKLLLREEHGTKKSFVASIKKRENDIWKFFFRTERKMFKKKGYSYHHMISTDGVGVSILFLREDLVGRKLPKIPIKVSNEMYIDKLEDYTHLQNKKIVGIDPGKEDLIYAVDNASKEANHFRYSQNQRRKETKLKKYNNIILAKKHNKIDDKTIIEYEMELSKYNRKTLNITKFKEYLKEKNRINHILFTFYQENLFRKLKFGRYINTKRSEQNMINNFKKKFGDPKNTIICIGDWEQKKQMKFKEPTLGIGIRRLFRKNKYKVYLVDEFRTSCKCSKCNGGDCEKFQKMTNPKPNKENEILVHGLLRCKNCSGTWNRDRNGASNIYKIAYNAINQIERPSYLCRPPTVSGLGTARYNYVVSEQARRPIKQAVS